LITPWDQKVLAYYPSVAVDAVQGRWLVTYSYAVTDTRSALIQGLSLSP
jgi:hypothetical protein